MICKQNMMDTLLRFNIDNKDNANNNKIASIMSKPDYQRTKEEKDELTVSIIEEMIQKGNNKELINKIAAVTSQIKTERGSCRISISA